MTDAERIDVDAIRARAEAATNLFNTQALSCIEILIHDDVPALCDEVERLRAREAAAVQWIKDWPQHQGSNADLIAMLEDAK